MASLENRTGYWSISFRFGAKKYNRSLKTKSRRAANELQKTVENTLWKIEQGLLAMPDDADVVSFLLSGGGSNEKPKAPETVSLKTLPDAYTEAIAGTLEASTLYGIDVHVRHLDGKVVETYKGPTPQEKMFILMALFQYSGRIGNVDPNMTYPRDFEIDYVRVYARASE